MSNILWAAGALLLPAIFTTCASPASKPVALLSAKKTLRMADGSTVVERRVRGLREGRTIVYQPDGQIRAILYFHEDKEDGVQRHFYPSGQLLSWEEFHQGKPHGSFYDFLEDGAVSTIRHFTDGMHTGQQLLFFDRPRNQIHKYTYTVVGDGKEWQDRYVVYDTLGRVIERTGFSQAYAERDTVAFGAFLVLHLRVGYPAHPLVAAVVNDCTEQFRLDNSAATCAVLGRNHAVTVRVPAIKRGAQVVSGYLSDFRKIGHQSKKGIAPTEEQRLYFAHSYYVK